MRRLLLASILLPLGTARAATTLAGPFDDSTASYTRVTNGGIENGTGSDANTWNEWTRGTFGRSATWHYKGSASAAINDLTWTGAGGGKAITQSVTVTGGGSYVLSGYIYHPGGSGNAYLDLADASYTQLDGGTGDCGASAVRGWPEWQFVSCPFKVGGSTTSVTVRMVVDATWTGSPAAFDEIAITPLASFVPPTSLDKDKDGYTVAEGDCDDLAAAVHPGAADAWYDGVDSNCDGADDYDQDADGFTALGASTGSADDCDDLKAAVHPGAADAWYDGVDSDCDGADDYDQDADGFTALGASTGSADDCDDLDGTVHPGAVDAWYDGVDGDCDGADDYDQDADGFTAIGASTGSADDCDDLIGAIHPGATDAWYDGVDSDCDGADDYDQDADGFTAIGAPTGSADDCDDADAAVDVAGTWYADDDGDGYGVSATVACERPADHALVAGDCDDGAASVFPGATEVCDGVDQDCDGVADDGLPTTRWYEDRDVDGFGDDAVFVDACEPPSGWIDVEGDCDDDDEAVNPDAAEVCDELDQDCDGLADEGLTLDVFYEDADEDGFGDPEAEVAACVAPEGTVVDATDCDDDDALVHPGAAELCNDHDDDCDELVDEDVAELTWHADADGDGFGDIGDAIEACDEPSGRVLDATDCDDADPDVHPGAEELAGDGIDQDCDGADRTLDSSRDWADPGETDAPPPGEGCGCATGPGSWWAALAALALVRRRRPS